jgi:hypothetical protein
MYTPFILKCPTGVYIWRGTIPEELADMVFESEQAAQDAWDSIAIEDYFAGYDVPGMGD